MNYKLIQINLRYNADQEYVKVPRAIVNWTITYFISLLLPIKLGFFLLLQKNINNFITNENPLYQQRNAGFRNH